MSLSIDMDRKGELGRDKIVIWILLLVFLLFILLLLFALDKINIRLIDGLFGIFE